MLTNVPPTPILRIVLTGFMGAGKSTLGALLAAELGWRFVDIDQVLVAAEGSSIAKLFANAGEARFRELEERTIAELLHLDHAVLALGGGALESAATRARLLDSSGTHVVFLETPLQVALARCDQQTGAVPRPVLRDQAGLEARFTQRLEHYRRAHLTLSTVDRPPSLLARLLLETLDPHLDRGGRSPE
jgi:shikimate kinase